MHARTHAHTHAHTLAVALTLCYMYVHLKCVPNAATPLAMQEWMAVIDAAIQGVPEQAQKRRETVSKQFRLKQVSL